jgi:hypothetical protein
MKPARADFQYTSVVPPSRVSALFGWRSFDEIVSRLANSPVISYEWEPYRTSLLSGCSRASFVLKVDSPMYDAFFNSPCGIRAMYAVSPSTGEAADRLLIDALTPTLLSFSNSDVPLHPWTAKSLGVREAKTWIVEPEVEDQLSSEPAIIFAPWERESLAGEGLRAPVGTLLEVKGGWLDASGAEQRNPNKAHRSLTLHKTGYI